MGFPIAYRAKTVSSRPTVYLSPAVFTVAFLPFTLILFSSIINSQVVAFGALTHGFVTVVVNQHRHQMSFTHLQASANTNSCNSHNSGSTSSSSSRSRGNPQDAKTARESAVSVDWEPVSELERRIEDGIHYEHWATTSSSSSSSSSHNTASHDPTDPSNNNNNNNNNDSRFHRSDTATPTVRGIFCGYRVTCDEYSRLKSAHPAKETSDGEQH